MGGFGNGTPNYKEFSSPQARKSYAEEILKRIDHNVVDESNFTKFKMPAKPKLPLTKSSSLSLKKSETLPWRSSSSVSSEFSPKYKKSNSSVTSEFIPKYKKSSSSVSSEFSPKYKKPNTMLSAINEIDVDVNSGPHYLKQARDLVSSGENPCRALHLALRAAKAFEKASNGKPNLDLVMSLHVAAAIYCILGKHKEAIDLLEKSISMPLLNKGLNHYLAKFSGYMQLGDTFAMYGDLENSLRCYKLGLDIQRQALGDKDLRVGDTYRYVSEACVQALEFDEAEKLCLMALQIHHESDVGSAEETSDRRLLGMICDSKGDHKKALEHFVLASTAMASTGEEAEVALVDCSIGDSYLSLSQYDQAVFSYQKALATFRATNGENHHTVAHVYVRLADLYNRTGKFRESKTFCECALKIYRNPSPGTPPEELANGLTELSAILENMNEQGPALELLQKAVRIYRDVPGQQSMVAAIEAQIGALYYMMGNYFDSYGMFKNAIEKLRMCGEKKGSVLGVVLNQMGLACVQCNAIEEAVVLFEEAKSIMESEYGKYHPDTLKVCGNLAGTYDALGRWNEAIDILEHMVGTREEKLGTANPDVDDEKRRLSELLKESGRVRHGKSFSLEFLLDKSSLMS